MTQSHPLKKYRHVPVRGHKYHFHIQGEVCCYIKGNKPQIKYLIKGFTDEYEEKKPNWCTLVEKATGTIYGGVKLEEIEITLC